MTAWAWVLDMELRQLASQILLKSSLPWHRLVVDALHLPSEFHAVWPGEFQIGVNPNTAAQ